MLEPLGVRTSVHFCRSQPVFESCYDGLAPRRSRRAATGEFDARRLKIPSRRASCPLAISVLPVYSMKKVISAAPLEQAFNCINCSLATREVRPHVIGEVARGRTEIGPRIEIEAKFGQDRQPRFAAQHLEALGHRGA